MEEGSEDLCMLERLEKALKPAIAHLREWPDVLPWIVRSETAGKRLLKVHIKCANSNCNNKLAAIRKHLNGRQWAIHVSGPGLVHSRCHKCAETKKKTLWLYLVVGQAGRSPRIKQAEEDSRQRLMDLS